MDFSSFWYAILIQWAALSPVWLTCLAGMIVAAVFWGRYPLPAALVFFAVLLLFMDTLAQPAISMSLVSMQVSRGWTMQQFGTISTVMAITVNLVRTLALVLLLVAAFVRRAAVPPLPVRPPVLPPPLR